MESGSASLVEQESKIIKSKITTNLMNFINSPQLICLKIENFSFLIRIIDK